MIVVNCIELGFSEFENVYKYMLLKNLMLMYIN